MLVIAQFPPPSNVAFFILKVFPTNFITANQISKFYHPVAKVILNYHLMRASNKFDNYTKRSTLVKYLLNIVLTLGARWAFGRKPIFKIRNLQHLSMFMVEI